MAKFEFKLPDIGEGVAEGEIVNWLVNAGDEVTENQEMVEVMTDKATVTIGAPKAGKVTELRFKVGDTVPVGQVLVVFEVGGGGADAPAPAAAAAAPAAAAPAAEAAPAAAKAPPAPPSRQAADERQPIRGLRKRIFENMARSKHTAAHFHYIDEVDVAAITALKDRAKPYAEKAGVKLTFLPFLVKAVVAALKRHPRLNSNIDEAAMELVLRKTYDIGIATSTEAGLMVPVVRGCDRMSILEIASEIDRVARAARDGKIQKEDLGGSSFTITSLGKLGGLMAPPIINYPEVGIMGVHAIKKKPVVRGDQIVIGEVMNLSWSFDHRIIDGDVGANFAQEIISYLQEPDRLVVEMA